MVKGKGKCEEEALALRKGRKLERNPSGVPFIQNHGNAVKPRCRSYQLRHFLVKLYKEKDLICCGGRMFQRMSDSKFYSKNLIKSEVNQIIYQVVSYNLQVYKEQGENALSQRISSEIMSKIERYLKDEK